MIQSCLKVLLIPSMESGCPPTPQIVPIIRGLMKINLIQNDFGLIVIPKFRPLREKSELSKNSPVAGLLNFKMPPKGIIFLSPKEVFKFGSYEKTCSLVVEVED